MLVAPDQELWERAGDAVCEVLAYESVLASPLQNLSALEEKDLKSRASDKQSSLKTSVVTAYRWVFCPDADGLAHTPLSVPATAREQIAQRAVDRLSSQDYGDPKVLTGMGAVYFNAKVASHLWKDESEPLDLAVALRRFPQWTYLPILPDREKTLRNCIREGVASKLWAVAIGDPSEGHYQSLIESRDDFDELGPLFDGSASLVKGDMRDLIRGELHPGTSVETPDAPGVPVPVDTPSATGSGRPPPPIPPPTRRLTSIRLSVRDLAVAKAGNLQPYLFKVLQEHDAGAEVQVTIQVTSERGIPEDVLEGRVVEAFELASQ